MANKQQTTSPERSLRAYERASRLLVGGVNSPVRAWGAVGGRPVFVERADGPYLYDLDGRQYVDLVGSWGTAIVGHAHPVVVEAVRRATENGLSFGACCEAEAELAELIVGAIPSLELVRFVNSGTEAVMSAIRLARAAAGRTKIIKFIGGYHGHVDSLLVAAGSGGATFGVANSAGIPPEFARTTLLCPYNDSEAVTRLLDEFGGDIAAILVEPIAGNMGYVEPSDGFLAALRGLCDRHKCLLIFDEVMTGFRVAWGGYQNTCGVRPDITCLGKVIGGGMPVAAYGGPRTIMEMVSPLGPVYQAGTLSGNPVGMAAGIATLRLCRVPGFYETLTANAKRMAEGLRKSANEAGVALQSSACGGMFGMFFCDRPVRNFSDAKAADHQRFARFFHEMLDRGVWLPPSGYEAMFLSAAHQNQHIALVCEAAAQALRSISS